MQDKIERIIEAVHRLWQSRHASGGSGHPDEETLACFRDKLLSPEEYRTIEQHVAQCQRCAELFGLAVKMAPDASVEVPPEVGERLRALVGVPKSPAQLCAEICVALGTKTLEIIATTADVLVDQEVIPGAVLRSREVREFRDEVVVLKDVRDMRLEVRIAAKSSACAAVSVVVKERQTLVLIKNIRVRLVKEGVELESYAGDSGRVCFEDVRPGRYTLEILEEGTAAAAVVIDIREGAAPA